MLVEGFQPKTIERFVTLNQYNGYSYEVKKFADKLKDIVCILLGCTRQQLEDREFKEKELGDEWNCWINNSRKINNPPQLSLKKPSDFFNDAGGVTYRKLTPRLLLQLIGTECGRQIIHPSIWVNALFSEYIDEKVYGPMYQDNGRGEPIDEDDYIPESKWIITDVRFSNELEAVKQRNGITIRINKGTLSMVKMAEEHASETVLDHITDWDYVIDNTGTILELIEKVREILIKENIIDGKV